MELAQFEAEKRPHPRPEKHITIEHNGLEKQFDFEPKDTVRVLLDRAVQAFGPLTNPHMLSLYDTANRELSDSKTLTEEGVKEGDHLLLRPGAVKGG